MGHPFTSRSGLVTEDSTEDDEGKVSYYTLSHVVVTKFAVTFSHKIVCSNTRCTYSYIHTCMYMYLWLLNGIVNLQVHVQVHTCTCICTHVDILMESTTCTSIYM